MISKRWSYLFNNSTAIMHVCTTQFFGVSRVSLMAFLCLFHRNNSATLFRWNKHTENFDKIYKDFSTCSLYHHTYVFLSKQKIIFFTPRKNILLVLYLSFSFSFFDINVFAMNTTLAGKSEAFFNFTYKTLLLRKDGLYTHRIPIFLRQHLVVKQLHVLISLWEPQHIHRFTASLIKEKNMPDIANEQSESFYF